jgi:hypothetical protein
MRQADIDLYRSETTLPPQDSLVQVTGGAILTSIRSVAGAIEARLFNPTESTVTAQLSLARALRAVRAIAVDFESNPTGELLAVDDNIVATILAAKKIVTIRLE